MLTLPILTVNKVIRAGILLLFAFSSICFGQVPKYSSKTGMAVETYAFLKGRTAVLERIAVEYPSLKSEIKAATKHTQKLYARAARNIEHFLAGELTQGDFQTLQNSFNAEINQQLDRPIEKEQYARDFLKRISDRSSSAKDSLLSKGIISFAYHDAPQQELADGHLKIFSTKNHPKSSDAALQLPIPSSWLPQEAEMPQTIQQFTSFYGKGMEKIVLMVFDFSPGKEFILDENTVREMIPSYSELIRTEVLQIDGRTAVMLELEEPLADGYSKIRMMQFMFIQNQKLYCLQGSIGPVENTRDLDLHLKKYEPLFRLVASRTEIEK